MNCKSPELAVVVPVYNEEDSIVDVLSKWSREMDRLGIDYQIHTYNDGSRDNTLSNLHAFARNKKRIIVHNQSNRGHGPTILRGYRQNCDVAWIFQIDSDDEMGPESFENLWEERHFYDFLLGRREARDSPVTRRIISFISRLTVRIFYGKGVWDVNSPYRLMRSAVFKDKFFSIPPETFAPNVILSGVACKEKMRIFEIDVPHRQRRKGEVSIKKFKLFKAAMKSFFQTATARFKLYRTSNT